MNTVHNTPPKRRVQTQIKNSADDTQKVRQQKEFTQINQARRSQQDINQSPIEDNNNLKQNITAADNTTTATIKIIQMQGLDSQQTEYKTYLQTEKLCQQQVTTPKFVNQQKKQQLGLGIFSFVSSDSFEKIEQLNDLKKNLISSGLYCVFLSALIVIVLGSIIQYLLFKNSYRTLLCCIILSILFIIGLAIFAFCKNYIAVGVVAIIFSVFICGLSLSMVENLASYTKISQKDNWIKNICQNYEKKIKTFYQQNFRSI
ncbi:hypothetical protein ABPG72_000471 [Tetrahymena utriculariae]